MTEMAGRVRADAEALRDDAGWRGIGTPSEVAIIFRELRTIREGRQSISLDGEYRAFIDGDRMSGGWFSHGALLGTFAFRAEG